MEISSLRRSKRKRKDSLDESAFKSKRLRTHSTTSSQSSASSSSSPEILRPKTIHNIQTRSSTPLSTLKTESSRLRYETTSYLFFFDFSDPLQSENPFQDFFVFSLFLTFFFLIFLSFPKNTNSQK